MNEEKTQVGPTPEKPPGNFRTDATMIAGLVAIFIGVKMLIGWGPQEHILRLTAIEFCGTLFFALAAREVIIQARRKFRRGAPETANPGEETTDPNPTA